jgi:hypothetical protein
MHRDDPLRARVRQRPQGYGVERTEDRGGGADA